MLILNRSTYRGGAKGGAAARLTLVELPTVRLSGDRLFPVGLGDDVGAVPYPDVDEAQAAGHMGERPDCEPETRMEVPLEVIAEPVAMS